MNFKETENKKLIFRCPSHLNKRLAIVFGNFVVDKVCRRRIQKLYLPDNSTTFKRNGIDAISLNNVDLYSILSDLADHIYWSLSTQADGIKYIFCLFLLFTIYEMS